MGLEQKQGVSTKATRMTNGHSVHKRKGFAPQTPDNDENDEIGGCHARKDPVCQNPTFLDSSKCRFVLLLKSEKVFVIQERVSGFSEKGLTSGEVRELLGKFGELPGKSGKLPGNPWIAA